MNLELYLRRLSDILYFVFKVSGNRVNHFHKKNEYLYVIIGRLKLYYRIENKIFNDIIKTGDFICIKSTYSHVFEVLENSLVIEFSQTKYEDIQGDSYHVKLI